MNLTFKICLIVLTLLIALSLSLFLRRSLVRRLNNTVLDTWLVQTFGVLILFPPLILAGILIPIINDWSIDALIHVWNGIQNRPSTDDIVRFVWSFIQTILLLALGIGCAGTIRKLIVRGLGVNHIDINLRTLIGRILYIITMTLVIFWALSVWNIPIGLPVTAIGVVTVAFTVAIQDILKDLVAGFYILVERPFHIGDQISTATFTGKVEDVQIRATKLRLVSGEEVTIPNSLVFGGTVVNNSYYAERRATITITLPEELFHQTETAQQALDALTDLEGILAKPEPTAKLTEIGSNADTKSKHITLTLRFWVASGHTATVSEVMYTLHAKLPEANLTVVESAGGL